MTPVSCSSKSGALDLENYDLVASLACILLHNQWSFARQMISWDRLVKSPIVRPPNPDQTLNYHPYGKI